LNRKVQSAVGFALMIVGVLLIVYGIYSITKYSFLASNVKDIVSKSALYMIVGGVVFLEGVVVQGFKKIYALILHLAAILPYYLAIQQILSVGNTGATAVQQYLSASEYYFIAGVILNILGLIANNLRRVREPATTPVQNA
jgi:hypothetical protein